MQRIILATDGSEHARRAAAVARRLALAYGAEVIVAHVLTPIPAYIIETTGAFNSTVNIDDLRRERARPVLDQALALLDLPADRVRTELLSGTAGNEIVRLARNSGADLVVVGSRGLSQLSELVVGSVSERVLRMAPCPVLIAR